VILPGAISRPNPPAGYTVVFLSFLYRGLSLPAHEFLLHLLRTYEIQLWQLTPNSILHVAVFITLCEAFLGIEPHFGLWKKIFYVKRYNSSNGSFVIGGVGFVARSEVNYFSFPMREYVQGWRLKWFYVKDSLTIESQLPCFADVLEAKPKDSWKNILSPDERAAADELFAKFLRIKEADGQTMIGTEVAAVFLKRRVQPIMVWPSISLIRRNLANNSSVVTFSSGERMFFQECFGLASRTSAKQGSWDSVVGESLT
jgi:hypothetical protein